MQGHVEEVVARTIHDVASGVAECIRRGRGECGSIVECVRGALAARQRQADPRHEIGPVGQSGVGGVECVVEDTERHAILQGNGSSQLPVPQHRPEGTHRRQTDYVTAADAAPHVERR